MKKWKIYKGLVDPWPDAFSHHYACWANNHNGWAKQKRKNRRVAKKRLKKQTIKMVYDEIPEVMYYPQVPGITPWVIDVDVDEMDDHYIDCDLHKKDGTCAGCYRFDTCEEALKKEK